MRRPRRIRDRQWMPVTSVALWIGGSAAIYYIQGGIRTTWWQSLLLVLAIVIVMVAISRSRSRRERS